MWNPINAEHHWEPTCCLIFSREILLLLFRFPVSKNICALMLEQAFKATKNTSVSGLFIMTFGYVRDAFLAWHT